MPTELFFAERSTAVQPSFHNGYIEAEFPVKQFVYLLRRSIINLCPLCPMFKHDYRPAFPDGLSATMQHRHFGPFHVYFDEVDASAGWQNVVEAIHFYSYLSHFLIAVWIIDFAE